MTTPEAALAALSAEEEAAIRAPMSGLRDALARALGDLLKTNPPSPVTSVIAREWADAILAALRADPEVVEIVANTMMDARMDGPWWKPPSTLTYQEAMRHYAGLVVAATLVPPEPE